MKITTAFEKLYPSLLNILLTFLLAAPFLWFYGFSIIWKLIWIAIFFAYNLFFELRFNRCPGMMLFGTYQERLRTVPQKILYIILYTMSFGTLLFYLWIPFDLLFLNLFVQIIAIRMTGNTLHGQIAGGVRSVKK